MELEYPFILYIGIIVLSILLFLQFKRKDTYTNGKKIANTKYVKKLEYYTELMKKYKMLTYSIKGICAFCILFCIILLARPLEEQSSEVTMYNRDIFLCMDVSTSVDELNKELVTSLRQVVKKLNGERFGITIFNTSSVLLVPLTDDYDYVLESLDTISKAIEERTKIMEENDGELNMNSQEYTYLQKYIQEGTLVGNMEKGSSLIGEGLASCIYNFPNFEEDRTRIIIMSTDNQLNGNSMITLGEAAEIAKNKNITVFGVTPKNVYNAKDYKNAVQITGGNFYVGTDLKSIPSIIKDIESKEKSLIKTKSQVKKVYRPQVPFILLVVLYIILVILNKKID